MQTVERKGIQPLIAGMNLEGRRIRLRVLDKRDLSTLLRWRNNVEDLMLWTAARTPVPEPVYFEELQGDYKNGMLRLGIEEKATHELIGQAFSYNRNADNGHAFLGIYLAPHKRKIGIGVEASALFIPYLFAYFNLVKLYFDVFEYNVPSLQMAQSAGMHQEGTFPKHVHFGGKRWNLYRFAIYAEDVERFAKLRARLELQSSIVSSRSTEPSLLTAAIRRVYLLGYSLVIGRRRRQSPTTTHAISCVQAR